MMPKISVIVAIYRVEAYLEQCLQSLVSQTYQDLEIILVDDGSPDNCFQICDRFASQDSRVRVVHQKNQGLVMARYNGALVATGDYLSFIDGDDWLEPSMYEEMAKMAASCDADVVITGYLSYAASVSLPKKNNIDSGIYSEEKLEEFWERALFDGKYYEFGVVPALWNKLLRRELVMEVGHPNPLVRMGEDAAISYPVMARAKTIIVDNEKKLYHYRLVEESMSRAFDEIYFERALYLLGGLKEKLADNVQMRGQLVYYALMISQIGIEQILSRKYPVPLMKKKKVIQDYKSSLNSMMGNKNIIKWSLLCLSTRWMMKSFWQGNIGRMIAIRYIYLVYGKLKKRYE